MIRKYLTLAFLITGFPVAGNAYAEQTEEQLPDISKMTEQEMGEIPEEIFKKLPAIEVFKKLRQLDPKIPMPDQVVEILSKVQLSRLMYFYIQADERLRLEEERKKQEGLQ